MFAKAQDAVIRTYSNKYLKVLFTAKNKLWSG